MISTDPVGSLFPEQNFCNPRLLFQTPCQANLPAHTPSNRIKNSATTFVFIHKLG